MKSIDKLKRLTGEAIAPDTKDQAGTTPSSPERKAELDELRRRIDNVVTRAAARSRAAQDEARTRGNQGLTEILEGCEIENEHGRFFLVSRVVKS
jgi:hypothetical protein